MPASLSARALLLLTLPLAFAACKKDKPVDSDSPTGGDDSAVDSEDTQDSPVDTDTAPPCTASVLSATPGDAAAGVYYRDPLVVSFDGDGSAATFSLTDSSGDSYALFSAWSEGNVQATFDVVLAPDTTYTLTAAVCDSAISHTFTTSHAGAPLIGGAESLIGLTWKFRLSDDADITEPAFLDALASQYLTVPILVGVTYADATTFDLLGSLGLYNQNDGTYTQDRSEDPWDFPPADFSQSPYFDTTAPLVTLFYQSVELPIEQFHLAGTIADDGSAIIEGRADGYLDTRNAGVFFNQPDNYEAVCDLAGSAGVTCVNCGDGLPYCLFIRAENINAELVPGLSLVE